MTQVPQCIYKACPCNDLDLFYSKVNIGRQCICMGKTFKMSFKVKVLQETGSRTILMILKKGTPGAHMLPPRGNIHVYLHNIQTSSPLKPLGQSRPTFM